VVTAPYGDAFLVQDLGEVVRVNIRQGKGDEPRAVLLWTVDRDPLYLPDLLVGVLPEPPLVLPDALHIQPSQVIHRRPEPDGLGDAHRPGLKLVG
jgi:hypothetical protein